MSLVSYWLSCVSGLVRCVAAQPDEGLRSPCEAEGQVAGLGGKGGWQHRQPCASTAASQVACVAACCILSTTLAVHSPAEMAEDEQLKSYSTLRLWGPRGTPADTNSTPLTT